MDPLTFDTYNKMAKEYDDETKVFWDIFPQTFLNTFIQLSGSRIADIGSGPGRDGLLLKQAGKTVICLDASQAMIALSKEKGLESILGDFNTLPFENESFDAIWSYTTLIHNRKSDIVRPLKEMYRILKPGGVVALGFIEGETEGYKMSLEVQSPRWFSYYKKNEIEQIMQTQSFELVYFEQFKPRSKMYLNFIFRKI